ncbi:hypothetical protein LCGC14_0394390 [marine sediment metagenome]|uniref:Uncharacterized protein n=1 Tax=marine sediment metagenome TaxID=412755 RepID=A0A0F9T4L1_9ZZZZ
MSTKTVELIIAIISTPPDDYAGSEQEAFPSEEALENTVRWIRQKWSERVDSYSMVTTLCGIKVDDQAALEDAE